MIGNLIKQRELGDLKPTPLTIEVHGWEFSERALHLGNELLAHLTPKASAVAIRIVWQPHIADIRDELAFADLVSKMCGQSCNGRAVTLVIGNISDAAHYDRVLDSRIFALSALCQVNDWGFLWYEPQNFNKAVDMFSRIWVYVKSILPQGKKHDPQVLRYHVRSCSSSEFESGVSLQLWRVLEEHGGFLAKP